MREIKFRFWHPQRGVMAQWEDAKKECNRLSLLALPDFIPMQYTGLKDKNGVEIYEGDIVRNTQNLRVGCRPCGIRGKETTGVYEDKDIVGRVEWKDGCFWFLSDEVHMYDSAFMRGVGRTKRERDANWLRQYKENVNKELHHMDLRREVIGNIHENPELLEAKP